MVLMKALGIKRQIHVNRRRERPAKHAPLRSLRGWGLPQNLRAQRRCGLPTSSEPHGRPPLRPHRRHQVRASGKSRVSPRSLHRNAPGAAEGRGDDGAGRRRPPSRKWGFVDRTTAGAGRRRLSGRGRGLVGGTAGDGTTQLSGRDQRLVDQAAGGRGDAGKRTRSGIGGRDGGGRGDVGSPDEAGIGGRGGPAQEGRDRARGAEPARRLSAGKRLSPAGPHRAGEAPGGGGGRAWACGNGAVAGSVGLRAAASGSSGGRAWAAAEVGGPEGNRCPVRVASSDRKRACPTGSGASRAAGRTRRAPGGPHAPSAQARSKLSLSRPQIPLAEASGWAAWARVRGPGVGGL